MSRFLREELTALKVYTPGEQPRDKSYIKLNTNESPYPPAPSVLAAIGKEQISELRLYSDPECLNLRNKLARCYEVAPDQVYLSNGSDDILNFAFMAYCGKSRPAYFPDITYGFYRVFANLYGTYATEVPLRSNFTVAVKDYFCRDGMIVIANPNAPTGIALSLCEIEEILKYNPDQVVVIDEAYVDFGAQSCVPLTALYPNLLVVQTFSKSRCMAGARLGFAIGNKALIADLNRIKFSTNPYNVNRLTLLAGEASIDADEYYKEKCREIIKTRLYTTRELKALGFIVLPSSANFLFAASDRINGRDLYLKLKERGILVRHFDAPRIDNFNRITIGTPEDMNTLLATVKNILGG